MKYLIPFAKLGSVLSIVYLLCVPTMAQGVDKGCSPTLASPCSSSSPSTNNSLPATGNEAARLNILIDRFNVVLNQLQAYQVPGIDDLYTMPAPAGLKELIARIDRIYVETSFHLSRRHWKYEQNIAALSSAPANSSAWETENRALEIKLASAPERLRNLEAQLVHIEARAKGEEYLAWDLRNNANIVEYDLVVARRSTIDPILDLLPADLKAAFREAAIRGEKLPAYTLQKLQELEVVTPKTVPIKLVVSKRDPEPYLKPRPIAGSIEAKLNALADLKSGLDNVDKMIRPQEKALAAFEKQATTLRKTNDSLWKRFQAYESPLEKAQALVDNAERRILNAQINQKISATNILRLAAAAVLWNHIKENVVIPQVEEVVRKNGLLKAVRGIALLDKIRRSPQDFIPRVGPLKDLPRLIQVSREIVSIEENWELFALAAADATGQIGTAESDTLIVHVFSSLNRSGIEIMRTASGAMQGTEGKIARALMERAPNE